MIALLRSMRFAVAVLCVVALAATIGSVLNQNQPTADYVGRYGAHWTALFRLAGLTDVYHAPWFLALLGFMATSTALCLWQRTPAMWREMRGFRAQRSRASLLRVPHHAAWPLDRVSASAAHPALRALAGGAGFALRQEPVAGAQGGWVLAARCGVGRRAGYVLVHGAMVLICVGGLVDGNLPLQWRLWRGDAAPAPLHLAPQDAPATARLPSNGGSWRAMLTVPEGGAADSAILAAGDGYLVQPLPFEVRLKRFSLEQHANGQPRDFASEIEIRDGDRVIPLTLRVNQPASYRGVTLYQSGFDDGGSTVLLRLGDGIERLRIGEAAALLAGGEPVTLEPIELRTVNVLARDTLPASWKRLARPGERSVDVGPSVLLRVRDRQGQAEEWLSYQKPFEIEGKRWFVFGRRAADASEMQYLRLPADAAGTLDGYRAWSAALNDPAARRAAAEQVAAGSRGPRLAATLRASAEHLLARYAVDGLPGIAQIVDAAPEGGAGLMLDLLRHAAARLAPGMPREQLNDSLLAYSEARAMRMTAPAELEGYAQVQASVLQVTRAPGASLVYLGSALLGLGVIAMTFIRERRLWLHYDGQTLLLALDANRPSPALDDEFAAHRAAIDQLLLIEVSHVHHAARA